MNNNASSMSGSQQEEQPMSGIENHNDHDVLCGRGGGSYKHLGNSTYRHLVNLNKELYLSCKKHEKIKISQAIVSAIRRQNPSGRFLEKDTKTGLWYDIGDKKAIEKTSQALREGAPKLRQLLSQKPNNDKGSSNEAPPFDGKQVNNYSNTVDNDAGRKRKTEEPSFGGAEVSAPQISSSMPNEANVSGSMTMPIGSGRDENMGKDQKISAALHSTEVSVPQEPFHPGHPSHEAGQQTSGPYYPSHYNMSYAAQMQQFQISSNSIGNASSTTLQHDNKTQIHINRETEFPSNLELEPDPIPFGSAEALQNFRESNVHQGKSATESAPHELPLTYDNHRFVPRHSMFRGSTQSILTDYSDMLEDIRSFDPEEDAFDDDLMGVDSLPTSNHLVVSGLEGLSDKIGTRSRSSLRYGDRRRSSRSTKRDSLMSIMSDITDISAALSAVQMEDAEDDDMKKEGRNTPRRQSVLRNIPEQESSRRGGFAINEFMAQDVQEMDGRRPVDNEAESKANGEQQPVSALNKNSVRRGHQDLSQAAAFLNESGWGVQHMQPQPASNGGMSLGMTRSTPGRVMPRTSSVRFTLPPEEHFNLNKIVNTDSRGSISYGPNTQRGSFAAHRRDTASSLLRRSILSNFTLGEMSDFTKEDLSDNDADLGKNASNELDDSFNPLMIWNAADTNARGNPGSYDQTH